MFIVQRAATVNLLLSSTVMGKRKLRFHQCKNFERKKYSNAPLPVSVNLSGSVVVYCVSIPLRFASSSTISTLHTRIPITSLPPNWGIMFDSEHNILSVYQLRSQPSQGDVSLDFSLTISSDFSWTINVCGQKYKSLDLLAASPSKLYSAQDVLGVVNLLLQCHICEGNADEKYIELIKHHSGILRSRDSCVKGILKDTCRLGTLYIHN